MTTPERALLVAVARLLGQLLIWKNIDGRNEGIGILELAKTVEAEGAAGVQGANWLASTADISDKDAAQSVLTGRSIAEIQADIAKVREGLAPGVPTPDGGQPK